MRRIAFVSLAALAALGATTAQAQDRYYGDGYRGGNSDGGYIRNDNSEGVRRAQYMCSGGRARDLEGRIENERYDGSIDGYTATRLHRRIDDLQDHQRDACTQMDWRYMTAIQSRYNEIERQLRYGND